MSRKLGNFVMLVVCLLVAARISSAQTYTFEQLTQNNTAACSVDGYGLLGNAYCAEAFPANAWPYSGWADEQWVIVNGVPQNPAPIITIDHDHHTPGAGSAIKGTCIESADFSCQSQAVLKFCI